MSPVFRARSGVLVLLLLVGLLATAGLATPGARAQSTTPVTGSVTGPDVAALGATVSLVINGTGGPAFAANGTQVGNITYYASVAGLNTTGVQVLPASQAIVNRTGRSVDLTAGQTPEVLTITVMISSTYLHQNVSLNITKTVTVVRPYVLTAVIVNSAVTTVLSFKVQVFLDGDLVGNVTVPTLTPGDEYNLTFDYATLGLAIGAHTFSISLANQHGLVTFANGAITYSTTFNVAGPAPDYTVWYVVGVVAFFGVLFILATRLAARRRGPARK